MEVVGEVSQEMFQFLMRMQACETGMRPEVPKHPTEEECTKSWRETVRLCN